MIGFQLKDRMTKLEYIVIEESIGTLIKAIEANTAAINNAIANGGPIITATGGEPPTEKPTSGAAVRPKKRRNQAQIAADTVLKNAKSTLKTAEKSGDAGLIAVSTEAVKKADFDKRTQDALANGEEPPTADEAEAPATTEEKAPAPKSETAAPPPKTDPVMTATATTTYEEYVKAGWNDAQLIDAGFMEAPVEAAAVMTFEELQEEMIELSKSKGAIAVVESIEAQGVKEVANLPAEKYADLLADLKSKPDTGTAPPPPK